MLNPLWYFSFIIPISGGIAMGIISRAGVSIEYQTIVILMTISWSIISIFSGCKLFSAWIHKVAHEGESPEPRDKYFEALNSAYDIKDRLKLLEKDAGRNIDRIYSMGKEAGYHDRAD